MHARIFFMWKSPDDPTPGTHMHAHTYSSYGAQQMAQIPGTRMHAHTYSSSGDQQMAHTQDTPIFYT